MGRGKKKASTPIQSKRQVGAASQAPSSPTFTIGGEIAGTSLQGYIYADYWLLEKLFGVVLQEEEDGDCKTDAWWTITGEDGTVASIYNYKDGVNYQAEQGRPVEEIDEWHIGGHGK